MKRYLLGFVALLVLAGCSATTHEATMSEPETLFTYNGQEYTENFVFASLIANDTGSTLINKLEAIAIEQMKQDTPIDITEALATQLEDIKAQLGDDYESYMTTYYGSEEAFIADVLELQVYLNEYFGAILRESGLDTVKSSYDMKTLNVYLFSSEEEANKVETLLQENNDIAAMEASISPEGQTSLVYTNKNTSFSDEMKAVVATITDPYSVSIYNDTENGYYYVFVVTDNELADDVILETLFQQTDYINTQMAAILKDTFGFEVYDSRLKSRLSVDYPSYVN